MLDMLRSWWQDKLLRGVLKNSGYLFSSNTISAGISMVSTILATRMLGASGFGLIVIVQTFASNVNRLLSFRMSEVVVRYLGQSLATAEIDSQVSQEGPTPARPSITAPGRAAAIVKGIGLVEAATSIVAYLVLLVLASWAASFFAKDTSIAPLIPFYGLMLLANLVYETSTGVLQAHKRFDRIAMVNAIQSAITLGLIIVAFVLKRSIYEVLAAYLAGKAFAGISITFLAFRQMDFSQGHGWWRASIRQVTEWRGILGFAVNTNLNGTVNLITRDNIPLYLPALSPAGLADTYTGYYKLGLSIINFVVLPIDPFIWPTYAEITRTIAQRQWQATRRLLRRVSTIAGAWTLSAAAAIAVFGWWLIPAVLGPNTEPVYPLTLILLIGYGAANILNWNRPLLLAFGKPWYPLLIAIGVGAIEVLLILLLVTTGGYLAMAAIFSGYLVVSIGITAWRGWLEIHRHEAADLFAAEPAAKL